MPQAPPGREMPQLHPKPNMPAANGTEMWTKLSGCTCGQRFLYILLFALCVVLLVAIAATASPAVAVGL